MVCCCFHTIVQERYSDESKSEVRGLKKEMFGYRSNVPKVRLTTDRLVVRPVHDRDARRLADYYAENKAFLKPREPVRDDSHCYPSGWQARLSMIAEFHKQGSAFYFALLDPEEKEIIGVANFSNVVRGSFHACYLGYSIGEKWQGQGLMFEALTSAIRYICSARSIFIALWPTTCRIISAAARCWRGWGLKKRVTPKIIC